MKKMFSIVFVTVICASTYGQNVISENGYSKIYYPNGSLQSEGVIKNGKPEGYWKNYYPTGVIKSEGKRKNFLLDSIWNFYSLTGNIKLRISYLEGKKNGYSYEYVTNSKNYVNIGNILSEELFINKKKEGKAKYFYENGNIKEEIYYKNNKKDGIAIKYSEDKRVIGIRNYRNGELIESQRINRYNEEGKKSGVWKEFYSDSKVKTESYYRNGLLEGYYKKYDLNGKLEVTFLYKEGVLIEELHEDQISVNEVIERYDDGNIKSEKYYKNGKPVGIHKEYIREKNIIHAKIYNNNHNLIMKGIMDMEGRKSGIWQEYNEDEKVIAKGRYSAGKKNGEWEYYYDNGNIEQKGSYVNNLYEGIWYWYYRNEEIWKEEEFYMGLEDGMYFEYDKDGLVIKEGKYVEGEKEGEWLTIINDFKAKGKYTNGVQDGKWKHYYDTGILSFEGSFIQGRADGKHRYYYGNGNLKEEQYYDVGLKQKHWRKYNELGELIIIITYKDDIEYRINGVKVNKDEI